MQGITVKCPDCGKDMEEGYLTVPLHQNIHSIKWSQTPEHHVLHGEIIYDPKRHGGRLRKVKIGFSIRANRCKECLCVVFHY